MPFKNAVTLGLNVFHILPMHSSFFLVLQTEERAEQEVLRVRGKHPNVLFANKEKKKLEKVKF